MTDKMINYIKQVEGDYLHRISTESDITSPGGIYRAEHSDAAIFGYIDSIASTLNINTPSTEWTPEEIKIINDNLNKSMVDVMLGEFYDKYLYGAHLELFPGELQVVMFNLYTNSNKGTWKSVQRTLIHFQKEGILNIEFDKLSTVDGQFGNKTETAIGLLDFSNSLITKAFKFELISNMRRYYADLVVYSPDKYLVSLHGWNNRMDNLYS